MKKNIAIALALVLTATLFTGCRRKNDSEQNTTPTILPTIMPTIAPTTETTAPPATTQASEPTRQTEDSQNETAGSDGFVHTEPSESSDPMEGRGGKGMNGQK